MKVAILGTGAYGLALALVFNKNNEVSMWTKFEQEKDEILSNREYKRVLPGIHIPDDITITTDMKECINNSEIVIIAIPAEFVGVTIDELKNYISGKEHFSIASKGIEQGTCRFINEVFEEYIKTDKLSIISGPSFAIDLASLGPTGLTLASTNQETINIISKSLENTHVKIRPSNDIYGTELCGSIKNVIAIASGMLDGLNTNESTKALFLTEAINDIKKLIVDLGGDKETILSFAGFGDFILTCTSPKSRNFTLGKIISTGSSEEIENYKKSTTIEGLYTLNAIYELIKRKNISMPTIEIVYDIIYNKKETKELLKFLLEKE